VKALVFEAPEKPVIVDIGMPDLSPNEVLVHTKAVGICHSDYELLAGRRAFERGLAVAAESGMPGPERLARAGLAACEAATADTLGR